MVMAPNGHFFGQIPHPMQRRSDMKAIFDSGVTSIQSFPVLTTGQDFLHSCRHFFGLHYGGGKAVSLGSISGRAWLKKKHTLSLLTIAILNLSASFLSTWQGKELPGQSVGHGGDFALPKPLRSFFDYSRLWKVAIAPPGLH